MPKSKAQCMKESRARKRKAAKAAGLVEFRGFVTPWRKEMLKAEEKENLSRLVPTK